MFLGTRGQQYRFSKQHLHIITLLGLHLVFADIIF